jgi:hypothetical protein
MHSASGSMNRLMSQGHAIRSMLAFNGDSMRSLSIVAAFYAGMLSLINVLYLLLWWYASSRHRLISPTLEQDVITNERLRRLVQLSILVISIGLAFITPFLAMAAWIAAGTPHFVQLGRRKSIRKGDE